MCGRFAFSAKTEDIERLLPEVKVDKEIPERYNIAPSQEVAAVINDRSNEITFLKWGLIPFWAKDPKIGNKMINARAESVRSKGSFKHPFKRKRCLVLADGFYEWKKEKGVSQKIPYFCRLKSGDPFTFAGLWDEWKDENDEPVRTFTIITCPPNELMKPIHDRMPVILNEECRKAWIEEGETSDPDFLEQCLRPYDADEMEAYEISRRVNSPANDDPEIIKPVDGEGE